MNVLEEIKKTVKMEIRPSSKGNEYLEAVVDAAELASLQSLLNKYLGAAAKEPGKEAKLPKEIKQLVDAMGGLRVEQSFYYKKEGAKAVFAALWPWESNPKKVTLKAGYTAL
jgi:hypothetical protein